MSFAAPSPVSAAQALGPIVSDLSRLLRREFDQRLKAWGVHLTRAQWLILYHVRRAEGSSQTDIADRLDLERMTVGRHAARLEAQGWLERRPDLHDARVIRLYLRPKARSTLDQLQPRVEQLRREYFVGISDERRDALFEDLAKIRANLLALGSSAPRTLSL